MKRISIIILLAGFVSSCGFLDVTPQDKITPGNYFHTETDLELFTNPYYNNLLDKTPYDEQSDHYTHLNLSGELRGGTYRSNPDNVSGWSWGTLSRINICLKYSSQCEDPAVVAKYNAISRFFRAFFYFEKVKRFGDVPWIEEELESDSPKLYAPRDSREFVMTKMLEDIDYAIDVLDDGISTFKVNKWAAYALKAQFCLYEGTWRKYHDDDEFKVEDDGGHGYDYYLNLAAEAAEAIITQGPYSLHPDYLMLFAQVDAAPNEYILAIKNSFALSIFQNCTAYAEMSTQGCPGLSKKFVDSFLMKDGSRFTDKEGWATMEFKDEVADRDPRLGYCTRLPGYKRIGGTTVLAPNYGASNGFQIAKFVMDETLEGVDRVDRSFNDMPVYRLGEIYLIYAEAKAELGTLTQGDLDMSVNRLRDRVGMPHLNMAEANANPDWYLSSEQYGYRRVRGNNAGVILEIRRERAVELAQEGKRWTDLMRWAEGLCVDQEMYGTYFPGPGEYDLTGDGLPDIGLYATQNKPGTYTAPVTFRLAADWKDYQDNSAECILLTNGVNGGYVDRHPQNVEVRSHHFNEKRDYLYPIPMVERTLNPHLTQNPGWDDGLTY